MKDLYELLMMGQGRSTKKVDWQAISQVPKLTSTVSFIEWRKRFGEIVMLMGAQDALQEAFQQLQLEYNALVSMGQVTAGTHPMHPLIRTLYSRQLERYFSHCMQVYLMLEKAVDGFPTAKAALLSINQGDVPAGCAAASSSLEL